MNRTSTTRIAAAIAGLTVAALFVACAPTGKIEAVPDRVVTYPLDTTATRAPSDSLERIKWTTRAFVPDPLAGGQEGPRLAIDAVLYGKDLIAAEIADTCAADSSADPEACLDARWAEYVTEHHPDSLLRIQLNLRSTFSVNSLDTRFWDIYLRGAEGIMHEPTTVIKHEPVVVRRDSLPEPGRAPVRAGLYTREVDLYFQIHTPFGATTLGPDVGRVVLVLSKNRHELATLTWRIRGVDSGEEETSRKGGRSRVEF